MSVRHYKLGLLGCGTVGQGLVELVARNRALIRERAGIDLRFTQILVRDPGKKRPGVDYDLLTTHPEKVINNGCDMVVELVGGLEPARTFIRHALSNRKHVVTANKALLAADGMALLRAAAEQRVQFGFEASVCGGIPIVRALEGGLVGNHIESITGILNGTCNYILTRMSEAGVSLEEALKKAQAEGFAEADPTLDVDGYDAAQKLKILSELAFGGALPPDSVEVEGIRNITAEDVEAARKWGYTIKQVAHAQSDTQAVSLRVHPVLLPNNHPLASVRDENNAVLVKGDAVGEIFFHGKGAGSLPSASAVLSDIVEIASRRRAFPRISGRALETSKRNTECQHYLRFPVEEPSAIGSISAILEKHHVGVARAAASWAKNPAMNNRVTILTLLSSEGAVRDALRCISDSGVLKGNVTSLKIAA
ncbi:MAG: homoserine dehydrogenase [Acidobacteria bacterium]|nr:MAG: homoserine dehydrogenase [Acidobacteriota bacterium]